MPFDLYRSETDPNRFSVFDKQTRQPAGELLHGLDGKWSPRSYPDRWFDTWEQAAEADPKYDGQPPNRGANRTGPDQQRARGGDHANRRLMDRIKSDRGLMYWAMEHSEFARFPNACQHCTEANRPRACEGRGLFMEPPWRDWTVWYWSTNRSDNAPRLRSNS